MTDRAPLPKGFRVRKGPRISFNPKGEKGEGNPWWGASNVAKNKSQKRGHNAKNGSKDRTTVDMLGAKRRNTSFARKDEKSIRHVRTCGFT